MAPGNQQQQQRPQQSEKDAYLEKMGLLNYQTKGMTAQQVAQKYAQAGVRTQGTWFKQNYGQDMPDPVAQPQVQINYSQPNTGGNATQGQPAQPQQRPPMSPDERSEIRYTPAPNGLVVKQKYSTVWLNGDPNAAAAQTADPNQPLFANVEQVKAGQANWEDVAAEERKALLADPNFYQKNEITKYEPGIQQQILADPNFQWDNLPKWQKTFFEISSNPKIMASPMALAGANAGSMFGTPGKIVGAAAGYAFGLVGGQEYDPTKGVAEQQTIAAKAMRVLNVLSEYAEQGAGYVGQVADAAIAGAQGNEQAAQAAKNMLFDPITREAAFEAGRLTYEYADFGGRAISNFMQMLSGEKEFAQSGEDFVLGAAGPVDKEKVKGTNPLTGEQQFYTDVMQVLLDTRKEIEAEIRAGGNPDEIVMRRLNEAAVFVGSQTQDLALQSTLDPLEYLPKMTVNAGGKIAEVTGNKVAAEAFNSSNAPLEAARKYKTLVQTGQALTIDPNFKVDQMGAFSRYVAGVNEQGQVKAGGLLPTKTGLLDPVNVDKTGWLQSMIEQTPQSRAQTGANMFYENVSALLTTFEDPHEAGKYLRALASSDMETWAQLGSRFAESPEFYTVLPALKEFNTGKLDAIVAQWDISLNNRDALTRISGILGEEPAKWLEDTAKRGTYDQDFQRLRERVRGMNSPEARAILKDIEAGIITPEFLKQTVELFTGEGALPWHPGQWKAMAMDAMGTHFDEWVTKRLMLDKSPEAVSAFYRTTALMKQAQSILLLGGSPGYAITNGLSNMVNRAITGIYGYMTPNQINGFMDRLGLTPARFDEGVGIGGQVEQAAGKSNVHTEAMTKAVKGKGPLTTAKENLAKLSRGMPMSKLSGWFESVEGKQGFAIAMKQFWSNSWRRGVGFSQMSPDMVNTIKGMGIAPERIYAAIEAGMNQTEIEKALFGRFEGVQARSLINDAAQKTGMSAAAAADMLEKVGVLDTLDTYLRGQTSKEGIQAAFAKANRIAQDYIDMQTGEDLKAIAESVKQRVGLEGAAAAMDVHQKAQSAYTDAWLDHYFRFGEVMNDLKLLDDPAQRIRAIDFNYEVSDGEFRRVEARNAATIKGLFDAWGVSNNPEAMKVLASIGEIGATMSNAYRTMREIRKGFFDKYRNDWENVDWDEWEANNRKIDNIFKQAFAGKKKAEIKQAAAIGNIYESLYGPAAGEAARLWWEDVVAFNDEMVAREQEFRASLADMDKDQRAAAKQQYYSETKRDMIVEMDRINAEGIARLERVIKRGNGGGQKAEGGKPTPPPTQPEAGAVPNEMQPADNTDAAKVAQVAKAEAKQKQTQQDRVEEFNALMAAAEQRKAADAKEIAARVDAVWEVASGYWAKGGYYERGILGAGKDKFALLNGLRKPEYGGIPDLTGIEDPRLTPEIVRQILENRKAYKEAAGNSAASAVISEQPTTKKWDVSQINEDTTLLRAIALHGGIDLNIAKDLTGEKKPKSAPGVFTRKGVNIDEMARMLADDGYPIDLNRPDDPGGVRQATELISRARAGNPVYPVGHDFSVDVAKAEAAYYDTFENVDSLYPPADPALWQTEFETAVTQGDLTKIWGMIGDYPETFDPAALDGYIRMADETAARVEAEARDLEVAQHMARAEEAIAIAETRAEAVTTRQMLKEKFAYAFGLNESQAQAYMELSDAAVGHFAKITGEDADALYSRYYKDVVKVEGEDGPQTVDLKQEDSQQMVNSPKGAVTFDADGIKATIHAFESGDFSTLIHENGHVFRRMLSDVAERTNNPYIKADLATIEDWAGVKDGVWDRAAEEKFARGFEKYITDGKAPTPALVKAFRSFKNWMIEIYKTITGSAIDVKLSPEVREVFGRMMGADGRTVADMHGNLMRVGDYVVFADKQMDIVDIFDDGRVVLENDRGDSVITSAGRFEKIVSQKIEVDQEASRIQAEETRAALLQNESFAENLRKIKEARAARNRGQSSVDGQQIYQAADPVRAWAGEYKSNTTKDSITFMVNETLPSEFSQALTDAGFTQTDLLGQEWKASKTPEAEDLINKIGVPEPVKRVNPYSPTVQTQQPNQPIQAGGQIIKEHGGLTHAQNYDGGRLTSEEFNLKAGDLLINQVVTYFKSDIMKDITVTENGEILPQTSKKYNTAISELRKAKMSMEEAGGGQEVQRQPQQFNADRNGQTDMFGLGEDMPLFSGTTMGAKLETYTPKVNEKQTTMFDMRPEFGAKVKKNLEKIQANKKGSGQSSVDSGQTLFQTADPVDSPAFQNWFGDSKVVDEDGRPLVVYHGTNADFQIFDRAFSQSGPSKFGFWFTDDPNYSEFFGDTQMPAYLKLENPKQITQSQWDSIREKHAKDTSWFETWRNKLIDEGHDGIIVKGQTESFGVRTPGVMAAFEPTQIKSKFNRGTFDPANPNILFQEANQPFGAYDAASGFHPQSEVQDQGWTQHVRPLMDAMQEGAINQLRERPIDGATRDMSPEGQKMLRQYMKKVQGEMATTKLATVRWGEKQRDFAMLNYNKRYGLDRVAETVFPYQFYMTRSMGTYAARILDKPAMYANYARLKNQQDRYERDIPERLRGKIKINAPWLPEWMGGGLYVDPSSLFFPAQMLKPFERAQQDKNYQTIETERILQEWSADGQYSQAEIASAAQNQSGKIWERANAEAKIRRESETSNPIDFFSSMFGPAWYLTTPLSLAGIKAFPNSGSPEKISPLPLGNTSRALDTVTDGTLAEPLGNLFGLLGKFEDWGRTKLNLPTRGEYGEYYTKRQVANMVAEGLITPEDASLAMIEKSGQIWEEAAQRVDMELAMRVPGMSGVYAALHDGPAAGAKAFLPSMLGAGLLPAGELEYRGLKQEWNDAWKKADAGDKTAITEFFEDHPEYEAYLAKGKDGDELLKSFLIGQIWDGYMELGTTNQKQARVEMGDLFAQSFLDKETRSYDTLDIETLTAWAQMLNQKVPQVQQVQPSAVSGQQVQTPPQMDLYSPAVTGITDRFFEGRKDLFPNYYEQQQGYYALPKSERAAYLMRNPDLKKYWAWKDSWYESYPQYVPIFNGQAFKTVDTSTWPPALEDFVRNYAYTGKRMPSGAYAALQQVWIMEGQPMGDFDTWVNSQVVPAMKYQGEGE